MTGIEDQTNCLGETHQRPGVYDFGVPLARCMPKKLHWSVPWSDLMMTMFIFFAVLYFFRTNSSPDLSGKGGNSPFQPSAPSSTVAQQASTETVVPATVKESMSNLYDFTKKTVEANDLKDFASVELVQDKAVRIILTGDLLFDTGRAEIKAEAKESLKNLAEIIRSTPYVVNVVGHTDDIPIRSVQFPTNWELSLIRASRVTRFLIEEMNLSGDRFFVTGHAYHQPVKPNTSVRNRAANRRVEIIITKERPGGMGEDPRVLTPALGRSAGRIPPPSDLWPWNTF